MGAECKNGGPGTAFQATAEYGATSALTEATTLVQASTTAETTPSAQNYISFSASTGEYISPNINQQGASHSFKCKAIEERDVFESILPVRFTHYSAIFLHSVPEYATHHDILFLLNTHVPGIFCSLEPLTTPHHSSIFGIARQEPGTWVVGFENPHDAAYALPHVIGKSVQGVLIVATAFTNQIDKIARPVSTIEQKDGLFQTYWNGNNKYQQYFGASSKCRCVST